MGERQKLTPNQEELIRDLRAKGQSPKAVAEYMKETFDIEVPLWKISYVVGKGPGGYKNKTKVPKEHKPRGSYVKRNKTEAIEQVVPIEQATQDIIKGLEQIRQGYTAIFMHLRLAVIQEAGKVFNMAKEAGIEIKGEDVAE